MGSGGHTALFSKSTFEMKSSFRYFLLILLTIILLSIGFITNGYGKHTLINAGYATRFAWDKKPKPFDVKTHFHGQNLSREENCRLNGWTLSHSKFFY
jgi:hypothetical protein